MSASLTMLRPADDSVAALSAALEAGSAARQTAERRLIELRASRNESLLDPTRSAKQVAAIEAMANETAIEIERMDLLRPALEEKLAAAREAARWSELERQQAAAEVACATFRAALGTYTEAAAGLLRSAGLNARPRQRSQLPIGPREHSGHWHGF
jgi:chromosome segregation ATPase